MYQTIFTKDPDNNQMHITREFAAPLEQVWQAWTDPEMIDQWWAPKPWKANTKYMRFEEGGHWLYCMQGPEGEQSWGRADFIKIVPLKIYEGIDCFCDEAGIKNDAFPVMAWKNEFIANGESTIVKIQITFASKEDLEKIVELGFETGFTAAHANLDTILAL